MKKIILDNAEVAHKGDYFVMLDGIKVAELLWDKWFRFKVILAGRYDLEIRIEISYHEEIFYLPIRSNSLYEKVTIECIGNKGSRMVVWYPYGSNRMAVSIYGGI